MVQVTKMGVNKNNIDIVLAEIDDFVSPFKNDGINKKELQVYEEIMEILKKIKD